jgi:hypothetical protein
MPPTLPPHRAGFEPPGAARKKAAAPFQDGRPRDSFVRRPYFVQQSAGLHDPHLSQHWSAVQHDLQSVLQHDAVQHDFCAAVAVEVTPVPTTAPTASNAAAT